MLQFFRRHQRIFLGVVATIIILSFSFFGTFSTFTNRSQAKDRVITQAIDGSEISVREVEILARFLEAYGRDVIARDFLQGKISEELTKHFIEKLKPDFGPQFLRLVAQYVMNAAKAAEKRGCKVKAEEVKSALVGSVFRSLQEMDPQAQLGDAQRVLLGHEQEAVGVWKNVVLFRKLVALEEKNAKIVEGPPVIEYTVPEIFQARDLYGLFKLQYYLEAVFDMKHPLLMPEKMHPVRDIEKKHPELVQVKAEVSWKEVHKDALIQRITLKETWAWQSAPEHFKLLEEHFPILRREKNLEKLPAQDRFKIDQFSRLKILEAHPEWIEEAFVRAHENKTSAIRLKGGLLAGIDPSFLFKEGTHSHENEKTYFRVEVEKMDPEKSLISYEEVISDGTLEELLDKKLEEAYVDVRRKNPEVFKLANGGWKPLSEVKDEVGKILYAPLLEAMGEGKNRFASWTSDSVLFPGVLNFRVEKREKKDVAASVARQEAKQKLMLKLLDEMLEKGSLAL